MKEIVIERETRLFALCESCFWSVSILDKRKCNTLLCPLCHKKRVVLIPLATNESFMHSFPDKGGLKLTLRS